ncbi:hypothetical protein SETIT_2G040800v2 [Setaria italica]|uniref:DUF4220 domain-containing protein n=1 Tax=Setaria italica TaxID=4555 RepID=K3ZQU3_SETIT|nr:uncharacterized protein LOC101784241 isoform X1 [Setaria italica]RCV09577.1 hypothetical protein SETIT_2G040800v2 [Setaria italica]
MAGGNSTIDCSYDALEQCSSMITCDASSWDKSFGEKIWLMNSLQLISAVLAGVIVGIGIYGQRYRHHRFTRFIFLGATTLFLPVVSTVVSMGAGNSNHSIVRGDIRFIAECQPRAQSILIVIWASLVQIIMINTSAVVAVDDREGGNVGPPFELLVQGVWIFYLGISNIIPMADGLFEIELILFALEATPFALTCAKMVLKYYAYEKARQSFALGRNPHLIFGYMKQQSLQETSHDGEPMVAEDAPPPLLVMGEEKRHVEKQPLGYVVKDDSWTTSHNNGLVTIDRVWRMDNVLPTSTLKPQKDLCLSFALFKLLRCRFARYKVRTAASKGTFSFFWSLLLKDGEHDRVFLVISDEVSFLHDYYYSSLPISYSKHWLPVAGILISLLSIAYCCASMITVTLVVVQLLLDVGFGPQSFACYFFCIRGKLRSDMYIQGYGNGYLGPVLLILLSVLVLMSEVRDIATYIYSNWTKVAVTCHLVNHASSQHSLLKKKWIGLLLRCRCKLMKHWDEKIGQCTMLEIRPRTTLPVLLRRLLHLPDHKRKVKVPAAVKVCIMEVVRSTRNGDLSNGTASLRCRGQVGEVLLWACNNKSTSYTILTWHIATSILEVRYPHRLDQQQGSSSPIPNTDYKIVATHLSRYCAYLVTWCPELLPDDDAWSRSLYEDVKKDVERVLAGCTAGDSLTPEANCQQLIEVLSADAKHEVLKEGARLGKQLLALVVEGEDDTAAWKLLAEFWSEMIVYVAPSDNLKGHSEAIARGGELITLLWVLLFHAGILSRPGEDDGVAPTSAGVV